MPDRRGSERSRVATVVVAIAVIMTAGLFAARHIQIAQSSDSDAILGLDSGESDRL
jgi:hypothetical protein